MRKSSFMLWMGIACAATTGCSQQASTGQPPSAATSAKQSPTTTGPHRPATTADDNTWGEYLAQQGKIHGKDVQGQPYIYLIPGGDTPAAINRRRELARSIVSSIGPIVIPGSLLVLGGPDPQETNALAAVLPKEGIKDNALKDVIVLIVSDAKDQDTISKAFKPTGATLRFVAM